MQPNWLIWCFLVCQDFNQTLCDRFTVSDWHHRFKLKMFFNYIHNRYLLMKMTDLSLYPKPNSCLLVETMIYHGNSCTAETILSATEATVLYCPSKIKYINSHLNLFRIHFQFVIMIASSKWPHASVELGSWSEMGFIRALCFESRRKQEQERMKMYFA